MPANAAEIGPFLFLEGKELKWESILYMIHLWQNWSGR